MNNYTIELPDGFVIDTEKSTDTKIVVKAIAQGQKTECKTYEQIQGYNASKRKVQAYVDSEAIVTSIRMDGHIPVSRILNHVPSKEIAEKIIALCQLYIIAEYYNDGWVPDWENEEETKVFAMHRYNENDPRWKWETLSGGASLGTPCFKSREILEEAYKHNKEIFKKALSV